MITKMERLSNLKKRYERFETTENEWRERYRAEIGEDPPKDMSRWQLYRSIVKHIKEV